jgi:hypothetical protein
MEAAGTQAGYPDRAMTPAPLLSVVRPPVFWRWALTVLFAAAVMVGLLGMHTLSSGHAQFPMATTASSAAAHEHSTVGAPAVDDAPPVVESGCTDCNSPSHDALMMVCLLGLLVTLLLAARSAPSLMMRARHSAVGVRAVAVLSSRVPPSLSLLELSISRT